MTQIAKIRAYIAQHSIPRPDLDELTFAEAAELSHAQGMTLIDALHLAHDYGRAKGYRAGRKAARA